MTLIKMKRADGAEAVVEEADVETWRGYGFEPEGSKPPKPNPFDHDGDGKAGGSLPGKKSTAAKGAAKRKKRAK